MKKKISITNYYSSSSIWWINRLNSGDSQAPFIYTIFKVLIYWEFSFYHDSAACILKMENNCCSTGRKIY